MASKRAERMLDMQHREQQNDRLNKMERMIAQLYEAQFGKSNKTTGKSTGKADEVGAVEPYEVAPEDLQESPVLEPVVKADADESKSGKGKK